MTVPLNKTKVEMTKELAQMRLALAVPYQAPGLLDPETYGPPPFVDYPDNVEVPDSLVLPDPTPVREFTAIDPVVVPVEVPVHEDWEVFPWRRLATGVGLFVTIVGVVLGGMYGLSSLVLGALESASAAVPIGMLLMVGVLIWATALLGFWGHSQPSAKGGRSAKVPRERPPMPWLFRPAEQSVSPVEASMRPTTVKVLRQPKPAKDRAPKTLSRPAAAPEPRVAHLFGRGRAACGADRPVRVRPARRSDPHCPECATAARSVIVEDDGTIHYYEAM